MRTHQTRELARNLIVGKYYSEASARDALRALGAGHVVELTDEYRAALAAARQYCPQCGRRVDL